MSDAARSGDVGDLNKFMYVYVLFFGHCACGFFLLRSLLGPMGFMCFTSLNTNTTRYHSPCCIDIHVFSVCCHQEHLSRIFLECINTGLER